MKGVESFLYLLAVAVVLLIVLGMFSSFSFLSSGASNVFEEFDLGTIGFEDTEASRILGIAPFRTGQTLSENVKTIGEADVRAGLFNSQPFNVPIDISEWYFAYLESAVLEFDIVATNQYDSLIVKWNGEEIYNARPGNGHYTIEIPINKILESNQLEMMTNGPIIMFWANTVYTLANIEFNIEYGPSKIEIFQLSHSDLNSFDRATLSFDSFGGGVLSVKVNGREIYQDSPDGPTEIEFNIADAPLRVGPNIISFEGLGGELSLQTINLGLFLFTDEIARAHSFEINAQTWAGLAQRGGGLIEYNVVEISRPGTVVVTLNGNELSASVPRTGSNTVGFTVREAVQGENVVEFTSTGSIEVSRVSIGFER